MFLGYIFKNQRLKTVVVRSKPCTRSPPPKANHVFWVTGRAPGPPTLGDFVHQYRGDFVHQYRGDLIHQYRGDFVHQYRGATGAPQIKCFLHAPGYAQPDWKFLSPPLACSPVFKVHTLSSPKNANHGALAT